MCYKCQRKYVQKNHNENHLQTQAPDIIFDEHGKYLQFLCNPLSNYFFLFCVRNRAVMIPKTAERGYTTCLRNKYINFNW
jgi:hypothetical protein